MRDKIDFDKDRQSLLDVSDLKENYLLLGASLNVANTMNSFNDEGQTQDMSLGSAQQLN